ncbi:MAG: hypothetical protein K0U20_08975 [Proteobacteria bacterium]|nr:hypothetical protein [Pseudomonadota bacterium]
MAINPLLQYPGKVAAATSDYPYGGAQNITTPGDGTGTPWEAAIVNDVLGMQQALLKANAVVPSGSPDKVAASQYLQAIIAIASGRATLYNETGAADAYVLNPVGDMQGPGSYFEGMIIEFTPANNNTGASTVNVDGLGVVNIKKGSPAVALTGGELVTTSRVKLRFDGTDFIKDVAEANIVLLDHQTASGSATIEFIDQLDNPYYEYRLDYYNVQPSVVAATFQLYQSDDSGVSWQPNLDLRALTSSQLLDGNINMWGLSENRAASFMVRQYIPGTVYSASVNNYGGAIPGTTIAADSLKVQFDTGNIATGEFFLYGINPR